MAFVITLPILPLTLTMFAPGIACPLGSGIVVTSTGRSALKSYQYLRQQALAWSPPAGNADLVEHYVGAIHGLLRDIAGNVQCLSEASCI
jgi:hypothetical protein